MVPVAPGKTWIIIPVFNRKETTLGCLKWLQGQGVTNWAQVVVSDGGSTDGTPDAIRSQFTEVHLLEGKWWWMEGIRAGMEYARQQGAEIYVWLNDDCRPRSGSLETLVKHAHETCSVSGGITYAQDGGAYTGARKTSKGPHVLTAGELEKAGILKVEMLVGNFVAIPETCVAKIGLPDAATYPHLFGDYYYTFEAAKAGFGCFLISAAAADDVHPPTQDRMSILRGNQPVSVIWKQLTEWNAHHGLLPAWRFYRRFWGVKGHAIVLKPWFKSWVLLALRIGLPAWLRKRL